jgi:hypothetical protein
MNILLNGLLRENAYYGSTIRTGIPTSVLSITTTPYNVGGDLGYIVLLVNCTGGSRTINLPTAANNTDCIVVKRVDASINNTLSVTAAGSETIDGSSTASIRAQYTSLTLVSDGTNWHII